MSQQGLDSFINALKTTPALAEAFAANVRKHAAENGSRNEIDTAAVISRFAGDMRPEATRENQEAYMKAFVVDLFAANLRGNTRRAKQFSADAARLAKGFDVTADEILVRFLEGGKPAPRPLPSNEGMATTAAVGEEGFHLLPTQAIGENTSGTGRATTMALGEEGPRVQPPSDPVATTLALGEEDKPVRTTLAVGEEGRNKPKPPPVTTQAVGEENRPPITRAVGEGEKPIKRTTMRVGEEGGKPKSPPVTTQAVGEEDKPVKPTTKAMGEEGKKPRKPSGPKR
jgi:hypothetical protein